MSRLHATLFSRVHGFSVSLFGVLYNSWGGEGGEGEREREREKGQGKEVGGEELRWMGKRKKERRRERERRRE